MNLFLDDIYLRVPLVRCQCFEYKKQYQAEKNNRREHVAEKTDKDKLWNTHVILTCADEIDTECCGNNKPERCNHVCLLLKFFVSGTLEHVRYVDIRIKTRIIRIRFPVNIRILLLYIFDKCLAT